MNFKFAQQINPHLERLAFDEALKIAETKLKKLPKTAFHDVIGKSMTHQADDLAKWIQKFFQKASKKVAIKALYFEMNEFDINTDLWFIDIFAFSSDGGLDLDDMEWICDYQADSRSLTETVFVIDGYKKLQKAFEKVELETKALQNARDWCEQIIIARFMELMRTAHLAAKKKKLQWAAVPIYFTEHAYDFIVQSKIK